MQKLPKYLELLTKFSPAIKKQFFCDSSPLSNDANDPFLEDDKYQKVKGLVHKYPGRALILMSKKCGAYCSFCSRKRFQKDLNDYEISPNDIKKMVGYIKSQPTINEIIFSGGDPLFAKNLILAIKEFSKISKIKILRIHTRSILSAPHLLNSELISTLKKTNKTIYISFHINHPDEITLKTKSIVKNLKNNGITLFSQTVFLKGINDSKETLKKLFLKLSEIGVIPYYIHRCDYVSGLQKFIVPLKKEIKIMTELEKELSGIALPKHVLDTPFGDGKIPIPSNFWKCDISEFIDYQEKKHKTY